MYGGRCDFWPSMRAMEAQNYTYIYNIPWCKLSGILERVQVAKVLLKGLCNDFSTCHISVVFCCLNNTLQSSEFFLLVNCHKRWFWSVFCTAQNSFPRLNGEISSMRAANKSRQNRDVVGRTRKKGDCCTVPATCYWTTNHSANSRSRVSRYE